MKSTDRERFRSQLVALARRISGDVQELVAETERQHASSEQNPRGQAEFDAGTYEKDLIILENEQHLKEEIDAALARLDAGTFGACEVCGGEIAHARLDALPYVRRCKPCAEK